MLLLRRLYHLLSGPSDVIVVDKLLDVGKLVMKIREAGPCLLPMLVILVPFILILDSGLHILKHETTLEITKPLGCEFYESIKGV